MTVIKPGSKKPSSAYHVYILRCADGTLYTGSTKNIADRLIAHNASPRGARYTRSRRPVSLAYSESFRGTNAKSSALKREHGIKKLTRTEKMLLIGSE